MIEGLREAAFFVCGRPLKGFRPAPHRAPSAPGQILRISCASDRNPGVALSPGVSCCMAFDAFGYDRGVTRAG
jgi:hypothetical protein